MSTGSPVLQLCRFATLFLLEFWLVGCTSTNNVQAPISQVGDNNAGSVMLNMASRRVPYRTSQNNIGSSSSNIVTQNGHIVYKRTYWNIPKDGYTGKTYTVKYGDTLFYIAWITGNNFRDLAKRNDIPAPYALNMGQILQIGNGARHAIITSGNAITAVDITRDRVVSTTPQIKLPPVAQQPVITYSGNLSSSTSSKVLVLGKKNIAITSSPSVVTAPSMTSSIKNGPMLIRGWRWPANGEIIDDFSGAEGGNRGIDIAGLRGQPVVATASGKVVYAGNALQGYGNLIIIKHNNDYISAYAHSDMMLVHELQEVRAGEKIATMGSTGTSLVRLHFEIRYKGKSVNPLRYLPQR
ncbi:murein hydrolase activator NlpD [Pantoea sp. Nvir]|uniref:murein hydrolase activator NlpD n=1 Tax=Pantoea sp. Nvir TaxID=2576760 RepID=UPI00135C8216|nr:murein hydrolase activator NlpD [Pantoea sp. Nvir]MXP66726.1 murein hydrolase activator NlpD [Pantoea sp. Nvir]